MQYIRGTREFRLAYKTAVTLGKFDGLHRGHQKLLSEVFRRAGDDMMSAVFTFETAPGSLMSGKPMATITTNAERRDKLEKAGVDYLVEYPFNKEVAKMDPEEFVSHVLVEQMHARAVVVGTDCRFGHKAAGDAKLLKELSRKYGFEAVIVEKLLDGTREISSTYVREELAAGHIRKANELLGYPYSITGTVIHGRHLGSTLGFPTMNISPPLQKLLPIYGVYLSRSLVDGKVYDSLTNIGRKPTVGDGQPVSVETFIYDFNQDLYGKEVEVQMLDFFRPEKKFGSLGELRRQVENDKRKGIDAHREMKKR